MAKKKAKKTAKKTTKKTKTKKKVTKLVAKSKKATKPAKKTTKKTAAKKTATKLVAKKATATKSAAPKATKTAAPKVTTIAAPKTATTATAATTTTATPTLPIGTDVPPLTLENVEGYTVNLNDVASQNRHLVLYFYPKDDTPGCTKEACDFRDNLGNLTEHGATVVGVSPDTKESHQNFANKYNLNFTLLADPNHELAEKMGVWKNKQFMGNSYMGVERSTFLFTDGKLSQIWSPVKVEGHVNEVIQAIEENKA